MVLTLSQINVLLLSQRVYSLFKVYENSYFKNVINSNEDKAEFSASSLVSSLQSNRLISVFSLSVLL